MIHAFDYATRLRAGLAKPRKQVAVVDDPEDIQRRYWDIGEVADQLGVATSAIRCWITWFKWDVGKSAKGNRKFTKEDIAAMTEIHRLLKVELFTVEGAKVKFKQWSRERSV